MCCGCSIKSSFGVYPYPRTTYFRDGPDPICRTSWSIVYSRSSLVWLQKIESLLDWGVGISELEISCGCARVWHGCVKVVDVGSAGAWDTRLMDTVFDIPFSSMVTVSNWTLIKRKGPRVGQNNSVYVPVLMDDALLFFVTTSKTYMVKVLLQRFLDYDYMVKVNENQLLFYKNKTTSIVGWNVANAWRSLNGVRTKRVRSWRDAIAVFFLSALSISICLYAQYTSDFKKKKIAIPSKALHLSKRGFEWISCFVTELGVR